MELKKGFVFRGLPEKPKVSAALAIPAVPLGLLQSLPGTWQGNGFNQIWRPFDGLPAQDRFLELNLTSETLQFEEIPGEIPNRGLLQADINLLGITYLQQVNDTNSKPPAGIHVEPGIWVTVPATTNPNEPATVARLATIPHGTALVAQGVATAINQPPTIPDVSITPFQIGNPSSTVQFPEATLANPTSFRSPPTLLAGITQQMVDNPNVVLRNAIARQTITQTTILQISTTRGVVSAPDAGGGADNVAFLTGNAGGPNAVAAEMDATFWIETVVDSTGKSFLQLQYSQRVLLNFNGLSWPHVSVATLVKQ
jgi:hypothetical protein